MKESKSVGKKEKVFKKGKKNIDPDGVKKAEAGGKGNREESDAWHGNDEPGALHCQNPDPESGPEERREKRARLGRFVRRNGVLKKKKCVAKKNEREKETGPGHRSQKNIKQEAENTRKRGGAHLYAKPAKPFGTKRR